MYANLDEALIRALEATRHEAARRATPGPTRAALQPGAIRLAAGKMLVRAGNRLAPETVPVTPVADNPC